jgi:hypothetical protein
VKMGPLAIVKWNKGVPLWKRLFAGALFIRVEKYRS